MSVGCNGCDLGSIVSGTYGRWIYVWAVSDGATHGYMFSATGNNGTPSKANFAWEYCALVGAIKIPRSDQYTHIWTANHFFGDGETIIPTTPNGRFYLALNAGTSGSSQPTWPTTIGGTVVDNNITWRCMLVTCATRQYGKWCTIDDSVNIYDYLNTDITSWTPYNLNLENGSGGQRYRTPLYINRQAMRFHIWTTESGTDGNFLCAADSAGDIKYGNIVTATHGNFNVGMAYYRANTVILPISQDAMYCMFETNVTGGNWICILIVGFEWNI
jgi:hypothetical protein